MTLHLSKATVVGSVDMVVQILKNRVILHGCGDAIPTLLAKIPDEFKPLAALGIGAFVLVFLALFHGVGLHWILVEQRRGERLLSLGRPRLIAASLLFGWSVFLMLDLHLVEILIWAGALNRLGLIVHAYDAVYFCANSYTTLGIGKVDVGEHWKIMSPIIGISGLFTFAWTTSALVDVVSSNGRLIDRLEEERERDMHLRFALRKKEWDALKTERDAERADKEKTETAEAGASIVQRLRNWREEKKRIAELRSEYRVEMKGLRRQERLSEKEAVSSSVPGSPQGNEKEKEKERGQPQS